MRSLTRVATTLTIAVSAFTAGQAQALDIADKPLVTVISVKPNIIVALDDSGSMSFEVSMDGTNDGSLWFSQPNNSFVRPDGTFYDNSDGSVRKTSYIFPWTEGPGRNSHYTVPPFIQYAFARSPDYNRAFYDPTTTYEPWPDVGGLTFTDSNPGAARMHALSNDTGGGSRGTRTVNLNDRTLCSSNDDYEFQIHDDMVVPAGTRIAGCSRARIGSDYRWGTGGSGTTETDREIDPVEWNPAEVFVVTTSGSYNVFGNSPNRSCSEPPRPDHYKRFEFNPSDFRGTGNIAALGPDGRCLERLDQDELDMQNYANWFTYFRKRHQATRNGLVASFGEVRLPIRSGYFTINNRRNVPMREFESDPNAAGDQRAVMLENIYKERFGGGTPNRLALQHAGEQFENQGIIQFACQKNFTMFFTDGFSTLSWSGTPGNRDAQEATFEGNAGKKISGVPPYSDNNSNSFADIAMQYYRDFDIPGGFESGKVPTPGACRSSQGSVVNADCKTDLHMNTYVVTLNAQGRVFNNTQDGFSWETVADAYEQAPDWPSVNGDRDNTQIDDLYHGAINGRGLMLNARTPQLLRDRFQQALTDIAAKSRSASALAATSTRISTDSRLYQSIYDTETWTGDLLAIDLEGNVDWQASDTIQTGEARNTFTYDGSDRVTLEWSNLDEQTQLAFLQRAVTAFGGDVLIDEFGNSAGAIGEALLDFVAGFVGDEQRNGGILRDRGFIDLDGNFVPNVLGDIVNSVPIVMGPRNEGWTRLPPGSGGGESYRSFVDEFKQNGRSPRTTLFVGANGGALQAFNAETGQELFAYYPEMVLEKTAELTHPEYDHEFYVDGTPVIADAFNGGWRTVLVGALGLGGRGYFALDVTTPSNPTVLWEFSNEDDGDLGFTIGEAVVTRAGDGTWVAVFGNGFDSDGNDGYLYVLNLFSGNVLAKIKTAEGSPTEPAGLASPRVLMNQEDGLTTESVYIGDLQGRMFRISASGSAGSWSVDGGGTPIFAAESDDGRTQPITAAPTLVRTPEGEVIVYFGTGQFFEVQDNTITTDQRIESFYALFDDLDSPSTMGRGDMTEIPLGGTVSVDGELVRTLGEVDIPESASGWFIDLFVSGEGKGERIVAAPRVRFGRLLFTTFQPVEDECTPGGIPRLYVLDARTGSPRLLQQVVIDDTGGGADGTEPVIESAGAVELGAGSPVVPPIAIDTTESCAPGQDCDGDGVPDNQGPIVCPFGRPVYAIDPSNPLNRILLGCLQEGRVNWGERVY